jgi:hypothetical protein
MATGSIAPPLRSRAVARIGDTSVVNARFNVWSAINASFRS